MIQQNMINITRKETMLFNHMDISPLLTICLVDGRNVSRLEAGKKYIVLWLHESRDGNIHQYRTNSALLYDRDPLEPAHFFDVVSPRVTTMMLQDIMFASDLAVTSTTGTMTTMVAAYMNEEALSGGGPMTEFFTSLSGNDLTEMVWEARCTKTAVREFVARMLPNRLNDRDALYHYDVIVHFTRRFARKMTKAKSTLTQFREVILPCLQCGASRSSNGRTQ